MKACLMPELWRRTGDPLDLHHFFIHGICGTCAAPDLVSPADDLLAQAQLLLADLQVWAGEQALAGKSLLAESDVLAPAVYDDAWLQRTFPELWRQCFDEGKCRMHPEHLVKMRKRFRIHVLREIENTGVPIKENLMETFAASIPKQPFAARFEALRDAVHSLHARVPGPYRMMRPIELSEGLNLNPFLRTRHTEFFVENTPAEPFYLGQELDPGHLLAVISGELQRATDPHRFSKDRELVEKLRQGVLFAMKDWQK